MIFLLAVMLSGMVIAQGMDEALVRAELAKGDKIGIWPDVGSTEKPYAVKNTDGGNLRLTDVARPELAVFAPTNALNAPAVIVCPGGGYAHLSYTAEGTEIAEWLRGQGIAAFVLKYRCPACPEKAFADVQRAISLVRSRAGEFRVNPLHIGIMGFSAGGHLAARASANWRHRSYSVVDRADACSCRPDFTLLIYPAYLVPGSGTSGSGDLPVVLKDDLPVDAQTPPAFLLQTQDDGAHVENALAYCIALKRAGVGAELHVYASGGHGYGIRKRGEEVDGWEALASKWLGRQVK